MPLWTNADGLVVKFDRSMGAKTKGGAVSIGAKHQIDFTIDYTDVLSATPAILGGSTEVFGIVVPEGFIPEALEVIATNAFTSSGTIGSATLVIGTKKASDRSTELDHDDFTTASFVAGVLDGEGERTYVVPGVTGAGDAWGVPYAENGVIVVSNSAHATHPYTAGKAVCRLYGYYV